MMLINGSYLLLFSPSEPPPGPQVSPLLTPGVREGDFIGL